MPEGMTGIQHVFVLQGKGKRIVMAISQVVGERIRRRRREQGLSLRELAGRIGMTAGYLSRVENQQVTPSLDALQAIATALNVPQADVEVAASGQSVADVIVVLGADFKPTSS